MRVLLLSDPHYDFHARLSRGFFLQEPTEPVDALVVAGDVANTAPAAEAFFALFDGRFPGAKRYYVLGNHCAWIGPHARQDQGGEPCLHAVARRHGFETTEEKERWAVRGGVLLFDLFYPPGMTDEQIAYTVDSDYMDVRARQFKLEERDLNVPAQHVVFSVSHMAPNERVPTKYATREPMFFNTDVDRVLRAFGSHVHLFGHTHEWADTVVDGVRYLNRPIGYDPPHGQLGDFIVEF